ncbi:hypothetical protein Zmor_011478 [Zophobas morio]|uniref:Uncharacterized protein n=1 Tax=Zophobas morio TaxID=2755281 RepID=A0AA38MJJ2_9CUCU|nr:hypothetical protein Zmor_011478 [Zophobas morio]
MSNVNCSCCGAIAEVHKTVNCCICDKAFKIECVNISAAEARKIHTKHSGLNYTCKNCVQLGNNITDLKKVIVELQNDIKTLKSIVLDQQSPNSPASLLEAEKIVQEVAEREKRKCNIIIYGCKEDNVKSNKEQIQLDETVVPKILSTLNVNEEQISFFRLGRFDGSKEIRCRPIKVILPTINNVNTALKNAASLKTSNDFASISISSDRTPMQIQIYKNTKFEMNNRITNGENNLRIKYKNGIPTIITLPTLN